jgi:DNA-binding NtrC family response regulator
MRQELTPEFSILVVDDEEHLLNSLYMTLKSEGIEVVQRCKDSRMVLTMLEEKKFTVIILDVCMPYVRGDELLPGIRRACPGVRVIMLTAEQDHELAKKCLDDGACAYLEKPVQASQLLDTINKYRNGRATGGSFQ